MNFGILLSPYSMREMKDICHELEWMHMGENQLGQVVVENGY